MYNKIKNHPLSPLVFVVIIVLILSVGYVKTMKRLYKEDPHVVTVAGKQYTRWTEFNGKYWQVIMLPIDTIK